MIKHFFSVPVPKETAEKIELFRRSFGVDLILPHVTIFPPNEGIPEDKIGIAEDIIAANRAFMFDWGNVTLWSHGEKEYVVIKAARGSGWHLAQLNAAVAGVVGVSSSKYIYTPHVTIGKFCSGNGAKRFECKVKQALLGVLKSFPVTAVEHYVKQNGHWEVRSVIHLTPR